MQMASQQARQPDCKVGLLQLHQWRQGQRRRMHIERRRMHKWHQRINNSYVIVEKDTATNHIMALDM